MLILIVNGIPAIKLASREEIPPRRGHEAWCVVDDRGRTIASYLPK